MVRIFQSTQVLLLAAALILFLVSLSLVVLSGVSPALALIWNVLSALDVNYQLLPSSVTQDPFIVIASLLNAFVFAIVAVALATLFFGFIRQLNIRKRITLGKVSRLRRHVILVPANNFARYLAKELDIAGISNVVIAEKDSDERALAAQKHLAIVGDPKSTESFMVAEVGRSRYVIACDDDDIQNAIITITAKSASPRVKVIARVTDLDNLSKLGRAGADQMVMPEVTAGAEIGNELVKRFGK